MTIEGTSSRPHRSERRSRLAIFSTLGACGLGSALDGNGRAVPDRVLYERPIAASVSLH